MYEFLEYRVGDVMTTEPVTIGRETPLSQVQRLFEAHDFNNLPVVEGGNRLIGIVSKLDLLKAFTFTSASIVPPYEEIMKRPAGTVLSAADETVEPDTPLTHVIETMIRTRHKSLPVTRDGALVGIVAREDILGALRRAVAGERPFRARER